MSQRSEITIATTRNSSAPTDESMPQAQHGPNMGTPVLPPSQDPSNRRSSTGGEDWGARGFLSTEAMSTDLPPAFLFFVNAFRFLSTSCGWSNATLEAIWSQRGRACRMLWNGPCPLDPMDERAVRSHAQRVHLALAADGGETIFAHLMDPPAPAEAPDPFVTSLLPIGRRAVAPVTPIVVDLTSTSPSLAPHGNIHPVVEPAQVTPLNPSLASHSNTLPVTDQIQVGPPLGNTPLPRVVLRHEDPVHRIAGAQMVQTALGDVVLDATASHTSSPSLFRTGSVAPLPTSLAHSGPTIVPHASLRPQVSAAVPVRVTTPSHVSASRSFETAALPDPILTRDDIEAAFPQRTQSTHQAAVSVLSSSLRGGVQSALPAGHSTTPQHYNSLMGSVVAGPLAYPHGGAETSAMDLTGFGPQIASNTPLSLSVVQGHLAVTGGPTNNNPQVSARIETARSGAALILATWLNQGSLHVSLAPQHVILLLVGNHLPPATLAWSLRAENLQTWALFASSQGLTTGPGDERLRQILTGVMMGRLENTQLRNPTGPQLSDARLEAYAENIAFELVGRPQLTSDTIGAIAGAVTPNNTTANNNMAGRGRNGQRRFGRGGRGGYGNNNNTSNNHNHGNSYGGSRRSTFQGQKGRGRGGQK